MPIPKISHLQFLVLGILGGLERRGQHVRDKLAEEGQHQSVPTFYQMMGRLERAGLVKGDNRPLVLDGKTFKERWYKVTSAGLTAADEAREFYAEQACKALTARGGRANVSKSTKAPGSPRGVPRAPRPPDGSGASSPRLLLPRPELARAAAAQSPAMPTTPPEQTSPGTASD